jgi:hypothetical protein
MPVSAASTVSAPGVVRTGGLGQARAGWILGLVGLLAFGAFIAAAATGKLDDDNDDSTVGVFELEVGKCYDIPLDLAGPTMDAQPDVFGFKPAPVQVLYLGYPGTSGAETRCACACLWS